MTSAGATPALRGPEAPYAEWSRAMTEQGVHAGLDPETAAHCLRYGRSVISIHSLVRGNPAMAQRLDSGLPFCAAEIAFGSSLEMVHHLDEVSKGDRTREK